ncbi:DUF1707 domain-containing protein [Kitasatospora sp. NBC_01287]|uniref:DUF1707 SHOCT-like domain-containing protein n=1 Tax=Kitasatospora sp. NBC_01287 TaxID=2903573 RepID=UPI002251E6DE|nr:DUF1707 domain-containing protein [Kitasatospora sp. NBC_01287]MCX4745463.1 DUF1707 domain-containing protein [Kitasatospora sp. NBC_01287]
MSGETSPQRRQAPEVRASHEDRDRVAEQLRLAAGEGRLTLEELDERLELALTARTGSELAELVADLPVVSGPTLRPAKDLAHIEVGSSTVRREGRWVVPRALEVSVRSGHVLLDLSEAVITHPTLRIALKLRSGSLVIVTRPGVEVDADDVTVASGSVRVVRGPSSPDAPPEPTMLRVELSGTVRSGSVVARPPRRRRRGPLAWLRRHPRPLPRG